MNTLYNKHTLKIVFIDRSYILFLYIFKDNFVQIKIDHKIVRYYKIINNENFL